GGDTATDVVPREGVGRGATFLGGRVLALGAVELQCRVHHDRNGVTTGIPGTEDREVRVARADARRVVGTRRLAHERERELDGAALLVEEVREADLHEPEAGLLR